MSTDFCTDFIEARRIYVAQRRRQWTLIADALASSGFAVKRRGRAGRGLSSYTSGGRLDPPFDLSGWMWVEARRDDVGIIVSLQTLDQDPQSLNIHVLMDRIGVGVFGDTDNPDVGGPLFEANTTGLELPLTPEDLEELLTLVETRIADHNGSRREV